MSKALENLLPEVREQYEELPYPERNPQDEKKRVLISSSAIFGDVNQRCFNGKQTFENYRVLVAGGGTGDAAISLAEALYDKKGSSVTYLDMSSASTKTAKERAKVRKLNNITWINDSLLNLPDMELEKFDFIDCTGVLHHLEDPDVGLKALKSVLKPEGAMFIMVYAPYGRSAIYIMQELMRMVNGEEPNPHKKIKNTKTILSNLPSYNLFNILRSVKVWKFGDTKNDAGIFDLFLHTQDRAYSILEAHDWLERCDLKIISDPGYSYEQKQYLPEFYMKDKKLLTKIKEYPLKIQQAIGEAMSTKISRQVFFATHKDRGNTEAKITDDDMIICKGITDLFDMKELANIALQRKDSFTLTIEKHPMKPQIEIPAGKYIASLLKQIDGERTVKEVIEAVKNSPKYEGKKVNEELLMEELDILLTSLRRGNVAFLRHTSVSHYKTTTQMQERVDNIYKK